MDRALTGAIGTAILLTALTACSASDVDAAADAELPACGAATGEPATGEPIKIGGISIDVPGLSWTATTSTAQAYFDCVNDNGGIDGRPIEYVVYHDGTDAAQTVGLLKQLIETDEVIGMVANASVMECIAGNGVYQEHGFFSIGEALPIDCFSQTNISPTSASSHASVAAAQVLVEELDVERIVSVVIQAPGVEQIQALVEEYGAQQGVEVIPITAPAPITDAAGLALQVSQAAGEGGGAVLSLGSDGSAPLLAAAAQQGLVDTVSWACVALCADPSVVASLDPAWNGKLHIVSDFALPSSEGTDNTLLQAVLAAYAPDLALNAQANNGFLGAKIAVDVLLGLPDEERTAEGFNAALSSVTGFESDLLCEPWFFGSGQFHLSNNNVRVVTPQDGVLVDSLPCFPMAAVPSNHLDEIRSAQ